MIDLFHKILFKFSGSKLKDQSYNVDDIVNDTPIVDTKLVDIPGAAIHVRDNDSSGPNCLSRALYF